MRKSALPSTWMVAVNVAVLGLAVGVYGEGRVRRTFFHSTDFGGALGGIGICAAGSGCR